MDMPNKKVITIFDGDFLLWTATQGIKVLDKDNNPIRIDNKFVYKDRTKQEVFKAADSIITSILSKTSANYYCGFLGACKSFRKEIYTDYKANRKDIEKPLYFNELKVYLYDNWNFVPAIEGLEADDAVNITRNNLKDDLDCIIVSSDKDLIKGIKGKYLNTRDLSIVETTEEAANRFFWKSMIVGDPIDNIKGIPTRGEVYANKVLEFIEEHNTGFAMEILDRYIRHFGEEEGIEEFRKNYKCLKILDKFPNFVMPKVKEWNEIDSFTKQSSNIELDLEGV